MFLLSLIVILLALPAAVATEEESIDKSQFQPLLIVERVNAEKAAAGGVFYVTLVIKNHNEHPAFNVTAQVSTLKEDENIFTRVKTPTLEEPDLEKIEGGQTRSLTFGIEVDSEAKSKDYNLLITLESQNVFFESAPRTTASINVPVTYELTYPHITVNNVKLDPRTPSARDTFSAIFYFENYSTAEARNVTVEIDGMENFRVVDFTNKKFMQTISRGAGNFVIFKLAAEEGRKNNSVKLKLTYDGAAQASEIQVNLPFGDVKPGSSPFLKVNSFSVQGTSRTGEHLLKLTLENLGQEKAMDVNLTLDGGSSIFILHGSNVDYIDQVDGSSQMVKQYYLGINPSQGSAHYPLKVTMNYLDRTGKSYSSTETLGISSTTLDSSAAVAGTPRVLISKYTLSDKQILAGNVVNLSLFLENTHARPVNNIKVSLGVIQIEGSTGGTVFSPVNSSNSFFIQQISSRTTVERSIDLYVDPNAGAKTYIVPVTIEYEDENASSYSVNEMVNIPVTQECKLQILSIEVPPVAYVGQPAFIGAEFVNVGKVILNNFIVMLEGDFHKEQASYFVGNLQIGSSDFYQGMLFPDTEGTLSGKLVFSYIDNNNKEVQVEEPFQIEVQAMGPMERFPGEMPSEFKDPQQQGGSFTRLLLYIIPLIVIALGVGIFLWRRKIKKNNEEFLDA